MENKTKKTIKPSIRRFKKIVKEFKSQVFIENTELTLKRPNMTKNDKILFQNGIELKNKKRFNISYPHLLNRIKKSKNK